MDEIVLVGAGGHARACIDVIELAGQYKIAGLVEKDESNSERNLGYPIVGTDEDLQNLRKKYQYAFITVGQIKSAAIRVQLFNMLKDLEYKLPLIVSPRAYVSKHAQIGDSTIVLHDAMVNANAKVGKNTIINNKALIEHDAFIGDHCHIATGVIVNGEVTIDNESFIGSGAVTRQSVSIGNNCIIGAGVIVKKDIDSDQVIKN